MGERDLAAGDRERMGERDLATGDLDLPRANMDNNMYSDHEYIYT